MAAERCEDVGKLDWLWHRACMDTKVGKVVHRESLFRQLYMQMLIAPWKRQSLQKLVSCFFPPGLP